MARPKHKSRSTRFGEATAKIQDALEEISELRDEIESWKTNLEGTNLENSQKFQDLQNCADALDQLYNDVENAVTEAESIEFPTMYS